MFRTLKKRELFVVSVILVGFGCYIIFSNTSEVYKRVLLKSPGIGSVFGEAQDNGTVLEQGGSLQGMTGSEKTSAGIKAIGVKHRPNSAQSVPSTTNATLKPTMTPRDLPLCPDEPEDLNPYVDALKRLKELKKNTSFLQALSPGGTYKPTDCRARERLAIVVPYRDRAAHLESFLLYMHAFLQKQKAHYTIFIAEMTKGTTFNTGLLQNVGFALANRTDNFTCFVIHDVDLLPLNETNLYRCAGVPKHLVHINSKYGTKQIFYTDYFGGAVAVTREQYVKANGFSNLYFGWGKQDDEFRFRLERAGYSNEHKWIRVPKEIGYYYAIPHHLDKGNPPNPNGDSLIQNFYPRMKYEGLNSLNYTQKDLKLRDKYTWILVQVDQYEILKDYSSILPWKPPKKTR